MSTIHHVDITCGCCGKTSHHVILGSATTFGAPDLDLRPAEMLRGTMGYWIQECPHCGYVAEDLSKETPMTPERMDPVYFRDEEVLNFSSRTARRYFRRFLIINRTSHEDPKINHDLDSFVALRNAAWACDDAKDQKNADFCRSGAAVHLKRLIENDPENRETYILVRADLLRRCGEFDTLIRDYGELEMSFPALNRILGFQLRKAREGDRRRYNLDHIQGCSQPPEPDEDE